MENICIQYEHEVEDYYNPNNIRDNYYFDSNKDTFNFLEEVDDFRKVIIKDFSRVLNYIIKYKKDSEELCEEINKLMNTYLNDVDFNLNGGFNFIILEDNYLCFNNIENYVDEFIWDALADEACVYETIVLVKRDFKEFYFIRKTTKIDDLEDIIEIKKFSVLEDEVLTEKVNGCFEITYKNFSSDKFIKEINKIKRIGVR